MGISNVHFALTINVRFEHYAQMSDLIEKQIPDFDTVEFNKLVDPILLRELLGWTQLEMSQQTGASRSMISKYETNFSHMTGPIKRGYWQLYHELKLGIRKPQTADDQNMGKSKEVANG